MLLPTPDLAVRTPLIPVSVCIGPGNSFWAMICATTQGNGRLSFQRYFSSTAMVQQQTVLPSKPSHWVLNASLDQMHDCTFSNGFPLSSSAWARAAQPEDHCQMARNQRGEGAYAQVFNFDFDAGEMVFNSFTLRDNKLHRATSRARVSSDGTNLSLPEPFEFAVSSFDELQQARASRDGICPQGGEPGIEQMLTPVVVRPTPRLRNEGSALAF